MKTKRTRSHISFFRSLFTRGRVFGAVALTLVATAGSLVSVYYFDHAEVHYLKVDSSEGSTAPTSTVQASFTKPSSASESVTQDQITPRIISTESTQETRIDSLEKEETIATQQLLTTSSASESATQDQITPRIISTESTQETRIDSLEKEETIATQQLLTTSSASESATQDQITPRIISTESTQETRIDSVEKEETIANQQLLTTALKSPIEIIEIESPNLISNAEKPTALEHNVTQEGAIQLVGIVIETSFESGQYAQDLEQLWRQYAQSEALFSLENTVDNKTYLAYSNYSEDGNQFTLIIGHRVANFEAVPSDLSQISIPATTYAQFNVTGNLDEAIPNTWEAIELSSLQRVYSTDLEVYDYQQENMAEIWASVN